MKQLVVSTPPHLKSPRTTKHIMIDVVIALLPAAIAGVVFFGPNALLILALSVLSAVLTEYVYAIVANKAWNNPSYFLTFWKGFDFSSVVTGLLLGMILPSTVDWYLPVLGAIFAIAVVKMMFGGTGKNVVNPAIAGRIFLFISFAAMTSYPTPQGMFHPCFTPEAENGILTGATPLTNLLANPEATVTGSNLLDLLFGFGVGGCIGETCKVALLLGYAYLVIRKVIKGWQPLLYIAVTGLFAVCLEGFDFTAFLPFSRADSFSVQSSWRQTMSPRPNPISEISSISWLWV